MERQAQCPYCHSLMEIPSGIAYGDEIKCARCGKASKAASDPEGAELVTLAETDRVG